METHVQASLSDRQSSRRSSECRPPCRNDTYLINIDRQYPKVRDLTTKPARYEGEDTSELSLTIDRKRTSIEREQGSHTQDLLVER